MPLQKVSLQLSCPLVKTVISIFQHKSCFPLLEFKIQQSPPGNKQNKKRRIQPSQDGKDTQKALTQLSKTFLTLEAHVLVSINKSI